VGRDARPRAALIDSPSGQTTARGGPPGYDGAKQLSGRQRHRLVDPIGLLLKVVVPVADIQERAGVTLLRTPVTGLFPCLTKGWVDTGDTGTGQAWSAPERGWEVELVKHAPRPRGRWVCPEPDRDPALFPRPKGFGHLPVRWVGARTIAGIGRSRRLSKDYEEVPTSGASMISWAMLRLMLRRLARTEV
jgi:putative transposase